ncbi:universal stress protein [Desulfonema magnum]|uniref:Universal stress protein A domain-containing protein n=1 Tax=Desulfonema magnum TaxID=45655 RepID=A0A975BKK1_9BACT|nr:universal stress protein [Desulfonema magnum]QTA87113.1 Universal stress protein A domain-containing protein [Desulfonema magnum]
MVPVIKKILFTTDLSENSRHAFCYAAALAMAHGAGIIMLHVMEESRTDIDQLLRNLFGEEKWQQMQEAHLMTAKDIIIGKRKQYDIIRDALANFPSFTDTDGGEFNTHNIIVSKGNVTEEILNVATENNCDLIVMGSHKGLLGKRGIGRVAKVVLNKTRVPVLLAPPPDVS